MLYERAIKALQSYHDAALELIAPGGEIPGFSLQTVSGMNRSHFMAMKEQVRQTGETIVVLICDTTRAAPELEHVWLMRPTADPKAIARGDNLDLLIDCKLWSPANDGPVLIIGPGQFDGHFVVPVGGTGMQCRPGKPVSDLSQGAARASARIARLAKSGAFLPRHGPSIMFAA